MSNEHQEQGVKAWNTRYCCSWQAEKSLFVAFRGITSMMGGRRHDKGTLKMRGDVALGMKESYFKNQINNGGQVTRSARNLTYVFH